MPKRIFLIALLAVNLSTLIYANPGQSDTFAKRSWTDSEIVGEMARFRFENPNERDEESLLIVSGFYDAGKYWRDLSSAVNLAVVPDQRATEIKEYLGSLPRVVDSSVASSVTVIAIERMGDWDCEVSEGCYPKGYVVGIAAIAEDRVDDVCALFRSNDWFCAKFNNAAASE